MLTRQVFLCFTVLPLMSCAHEVAPMSPFTAAVEALARTPPDGLLQVEGRTLAWAEYGEPGGAAVFYFSGGDSSRLEGRSLARAASVLGVRVIAPDRPGFGHSTAHEARTLVDWPKDVEAIADHLGLERFGVIGLSGGGPHAMATAWGMPERVTSLVVVASAPLPELESQTRDVGLPFRMIAKVTRYAPWAMRFILDDQRKMASAAPEELLERTRGGVGEADARWLADEEGGALFAASMRVAYREGIDGSLQEHQLYRRAWGFQLQDIVVPTTFFIGDEDVLASRRVNEQMATSVPNARFEIIEGEGHLSLIPRRARRVLAAALQQQ